MQFGHDAEIDVVTTTSSHDTTASTNCSRHNQIKWQNHNTSTSTSSSAAIPQRNRSRAKATQKNEACREKKTNKNVQDDTTGKGGNTTTCRKGEEVFSNDDSITTAVVVEERTKKQVLRISRVPWIFGAVGIFITLCIIAAVVSLEYTRMIGAVQEMVVEQAETVLEGAVLSLNAFNNKIISATWVMQDEIRTAGNSSTVPFEQIDKMRAVLRKEMVMRLIGDPNDMGYCVTIVGPPVAPENIPKQDLTVQGECIGLCRRDEQDPLYTDIAEYGLIRDNIIGRDVDEFRLLAATDPVNTSFFPMYVVNRTQRTAPSWAVPTTSSKNQVQLQDFTQGSAYRVGSSLVAYTNGSAFDGIWNPLAVTTSPSGQSYYFFKYRQAFIHPLSNLTVIFTNYVSANQYQYVLTQYAQQVGGNNGHLILVDGRARVIGYNQDPYGDNRLANCTTSVAPGTPNRGCDDFYAITHPSSFVRSLFGQYQEFIMAKNLNIRKKWFEESDTKYLLVVKPILDVGATRIIASFSLREQDVLGSLKRDATVIVAISAIAIAAGCFVLIFAGFASLLEANQTVVLVAKIAGCIARYDVDAADEVVTKAQHDRICCKDPTAMELQFTLIVSNLRAYRPFLPAAMLLEHTDNKRTSSNASFSDFSDKPLNKFATFTGSLLLVDVGNLPMGTTVMYREQQELGELIGTFLSVCIDIVQKHGGVSEVIQANQLLVSFNCHSRVALHEDVACQCALELRRALGSGSKWCGHAMNVAISITTGHGLVGSAGSSSVKARMLAGEPVDLIRKLPALQRMMGVSILITEATSHGLSVGTVRVPVDLVTPTWWQLGRSEELLMYEVVGTDLTNLEEIQTATIRTSAFTALHRDEDPREGVKLLATVPATLRPQFAVVRMEALCSVVREANPAKLTGRTELPWEQLEGRTFYHGSTSRRIIEESLWGDTSVSHTSHTYFPNIPNASKSRSLSDSFAAPPAEIMVPSMDAIKAESSSSGDVSSSTLASTSSSNPLFGLYANPLTSKARLLASASHCTSLMTSTSVTHHVASSHGGGGGPTSSGSVSKKLSVGSPSSSTPAARGRCGSSITSPHEGLSVTTLLNSNTTPQKQQNRSSVGVTNNTSSSTTLDQSKRSDTGILSNSADLASDSLSALLFASMSSSPPPDSHTSHNNVLIALSGDKYHMTGETLRKGTLGNVVLALHETGGFVAVKQIPMQYLDGEVDTLVTGLELLSSLNHPNIASYVTCAVNKRDATFCIMTEYLAAGTLSDLIKVSVPYVPVQIAIKYAREIANGLHYLHTRSPPILHLDIKPQKILMTADGSCKLIDLGLSKVIQSLPANTRPTPHYMAPETVRGEFSPASDIYSLGITILHMLLGKVPWHATENDAAFLQDLQNGSSPLVPNSLDPQLAALLRQCTSPISTHRPTAKYVVEFLARWKPMDMTLSTSSPLQHQSQNLLPTSSSSTADAAVRDDPIFSSAEVYLQHYQASVSKNKQ